ncbi:MAG: DsbC family protein [Deltaproteobacteria bacterium]|nr:DsbC family protein [Deltaproteobacteria bacterium]
MIRKLFLALAFSSICLIAPAGTASAFQGATAGKCSDCHTLTKEEVGKALNLERYKAQVKDIRMSPVKGLWEIELTQDDKVFIVYMDFSKKYLVEGRFTSLEKIKESESLKKVDLKKIPLENAVVMGNPKAEKKIIIFDDPDCPYCAKLHDEVKKILAKRNDVAFYIKMYPLAIHPEAYEKSKAIVCNKSAKLLNDAFTGKKLPKAECETQELDNNIKLAEDLGLRGTPALVFPDGRLLPGYVPSEAILGLLDNPQ